MVVKHFDFGWLEPIITRQESFCVACAVVEPRRGSVSVSKIGIRSCVGIGVVCDVKVVSSTKCRSIAIVGIDSVIMISINGCFEWL